ncbi:hypothetical protein D3C79_882810 [compost metagenome]
MLREAWPLYSRVGVTLIRRSDIAARRLPVRTVSAMVVTPSYLAGRLLSRERNACQNTWSRVLPPLTGSVRRIRISYCPGDTL